MSAPKVFQFKLVLLGDSAVGKSSLVLRFVRGQFFEYQESTIGGAMPPTPGRRGGALVFPRGSSGGCERFVQTEHGAGASRPIWAAGRERGRGWGDACSRPRARRAAPPRAWPLPLRCRSDHALGVCRAQLHS